MIKKIMALSLAISIAPQTQASELISILQNNKPLIMGTCFSGWLLRYGLNLKHGFAEKEKTLVESEHLTNTRLLVDNIIEQMQNDHKKFPKETQTWNATCTAHPSKAISTDIANKYGLSKNAVQAFNNELTTENDLSAQSSGNCKLFAQKRFF